MKRMFAALACCLATSNFCLAEPESGEVAFAPPAGDEMVEGRFKLEPHTFQYTREGLPTVSTAIEIQEIKFPSPVETPHANNNTVHCEYFRPVEEGTYPGVVMLHILGGDFDLSRLVCRELASNGVTALFVKMPYYGPRAEPGVDMEMISDDPDATVANLTQAVLDIRRAAAWLASQPEVNPDQLGVAGISLGGITGALAFTAEPRFNKAFLMLAGGDIGRVAWDSPIVAEQREKMIAAGITREKMIEMVAPVDPFTYGENAKGRQVLMLNARLDEIVPPDCSQALWESFGKPEIFWVDAGHYSAMRFIFDAMSAAVDFFQPEYEPGRFSSAR